MMGMWVYLLVGREMVDSIRYLVVDRYTERMVLIFSFSLAFRLSGIN